MRAASALLVASVVTLGATGQNAVTPTPLRGIYGGVPQEILDPPPPARVR